MKLTLRSALSILLAVLFFSGLFLVGGLTICGNFTDLYDSARLMTKLSNYLPEDWNGFDLFAARIRSFDSEFSDVLWGSTELGYFNSALQITAGDEIVNTGSASMILCTTGHLHDLVKKSDMQPIADEIAALAAISEEQDIPFLFVYAHPTLYEEGMLPDGIDDLDFTDENAAELMAHLAGSGVPTIDSRDCLMNSGYGIDELTYFTDQHWTSLSALLMAEYVAGELQEMGLPVDPALLDISKFDSVTAEDIFLGKYGQRMGPDLITPDDLTAYWPTYDTSITRYTLNNGKETTASGSFKEAAIRWYEFEPLEGESWNILGYRHYGLTEDMDVYTNTGRVETDDPFTVLIFKDSYSAAIGAFLSLTADEIVSIDLRKTDKSAEELIREYQPDCVIMAYSLQMLTEGRSAYTILEED